MIPLLLLLVFALAKPGYRYEFPRDHFAHPDFQTEWWYFTGNLRDPAGRRFGIELTFFRQAVSSTRSPAHPWDATDIYLAHLTLSDISTGRFHHYERVNRAGPGLAGADLGRGLIWNGNWQARLDSLRAVAETFSFDLRFRSRKPPVIHGANGVSQKAPGPGRASHYISLTRLETSGTLTVEGRPFEVTGSLWMDHEFFTHQLEPDQTGWDWMSIQLDNNEELMLFRLRRRDGSLDPYSAGTHIDARGRTRHLTARDFTLQPGARWPSPATGARYPLEWTIRVPSLDLELRATTAMPNQELVSKNSWSPTYWEGAMDYRGSLARRPVSGSGYLEMTGYDRPVRFPAPLP